MQHFCQMTVLKSEHAADTEHEAGECRKEFIGYFFTAAEAMKDSR